MMLRRMLLVCLLVFGVLTATELLVPLSGFAAEPNRLNPAELAAAIAQVQKVGREKADYRPGQAALKQLQTQDGTVLLPLLKAIGQSTPIAANWLLSTFETVAGNEIAGGKTLPIADFKAYALNTKNESRSRRLAYEWVLKTEPAFETEALAGMLRDPSPEFRRDAVAVVMAAAKEAIAEGDKSAAAARYREALSGATDDDQVREIVAFLRDQGDTVNLPQHFGFLTNWKLIGPFDNTDKQGFDVAYPPESELAFDDHYDGKLGQVTWIDSSTSDDYGVVDLRKALAHHKGAITYAVTKFESADAQTVDLRLGTPNAWKIWVNGNLLFARDEYHRGTQMDQYTIKANLKPGPNTILLKVCQNEQTEEWAQDWQFQIRVCDAAGAAILAASR